MRQASAGPPAGVGPGREAEAGFAHGDCRDTAIGT